MFSIITSGHCGEISAAEEAAAGSQGKQASSCSLQIMLLVEVLTSKNRHLNGQK